MPIYRKQPDYFADVLTHELIHNIFTQNRTKIEKALKKFKQRYPEETQRTIIHILVYAVHSHIYCKFFSKKRINRDVKSVNIYPEYRKSWEIVQAEGYKNIIKELEKFVKKLK